MLYRKIIKDLENWKAKEKTALLIKGARQVGKTKIIESFIDGFENHIEIDFTKDLEALNMLLEVKNYNDFVNRLSLISKTKLTSSSNSVLFLDEIQYYYEVRENRINRDPLFRDKFIDIITLSKEISEKGEFRLILSGSMLGIIIFQINHNPTGYLKELTMYPMDFEEFLLANNINQTIIEEVKQCFVDKVEVPESINNLFLQKYNEYLFVGGYPAAVQAYIDDKSLDLTESALQTIDSWYKEDIIKYAAKEDRLIILEMYNLLAKEISKKNKKFVKSHMDVPNFKNLDLKDRFLWMSNAGIAIPTYNVTNPIYPLSISEDSKITKLFISDVGLLTYKLFDKEGRRKLIIDPSGVDLGSVTENFVSQSLKAHYFSDVYFHSNKKRGEIDFIIEKNMEIIPLEIKSYAPDKNSNKFEHAALDNLLEAHKEIKEAWVFGINNVRKEDKNIQMFPIYMADFIR